MSNCSFCGSTEVSTIPPKELSIFFQNIFNLYVTNAEGAKLTNQLIHDFSGMIFAKKLDGKEEQLLEHIISESKDLDNLLNSNVLLNHKADQSKADQFKALEVTWMELTNEIKNVNRFHLQNTIDLDKLSHLIRRYERTIYKGKRFFRARISDENGFSASEMMNPPKEKAKAGRANPTGISYLYLSDNIKTTFYETRSTVYDFVTVAEFQLQENIDVINLRGDTYDPILLADNDHLEDFLIHEPFISNLQENLSKPKRRHDNELDYLPTQYLSEFIKSIGFEGVEFQSSLHSEGYNLAVFDPNKFQCLNTKTYEITNVDLRHRQI